MKLWVYGRYKGQDHLNVNWDFQGIFSSEEKAVEACRDRTYFAAPTELDVSLPHSTTKWPGCYYPFVKSK